MQHVKYLDTAAITNEHSMTSYNRCMQFYYFTQSKLYNNLKKYIKMLCQLYM